MKRTKKLISMLSLAVAFCCLQVFGVGLIGVQAQEMKNNVQTEPVTITNGSFGEYNASSTSLDSDPTGWTKGSGSAKKGVINVDTSLFGSNFSKYFLKATSNPGKTGTDNKILMINSVTDLSSETPNYFVDSYTSNEISLASYSYYKFSVSVCTMPDSYASVNIIGLENYDLTTNESSCYITGISNGAYSTFENDQHQIEKVWEPNGSAIWTEYSFYISTNFEAPSIKLQLSLGKVSNEDSVASTGAVFFDQVRGVKCSESEYYNLKSLELDASQFSEIKMKSYDITPNAWTFEDFENDFEFENCTGETTNFQAGLIDTTTSDFGTDFTYNNTKAIRISADEQNASYIKYKTKSIKIESGKNYRIAINVKTADIENGNVVLKLIETDYLEQTYGLTNHEIKSAELTITNTETSKLTNDYITYCFYVAGYEYYDTEIYLELSLGSTDNLASGTVVFNTISVKQYPYDKFSTITTGSTIQTLSFSASSGSPSFTNGYFDKAHSYDITKSYPLRDSDWTVTAENNTTSTYGIVNIAKWDQIPNDLIMTNPLNPAIYINGQRFARDAYSPNNIFMLHNKISTYQTATSPSFSLDANSYYNLSFSYAVFGNQLLNIKVIDSDNNVIFKDLMLGSQTEWALYNIYFKTEFDSAKSFNLILELGTEDNKKSGYVFVDDIQLEKQENFTDTEFQTLIDQDKHTINLSGLNFYLTGDKLNASNIYAAIGFTGTLENDDNPNIAFGGIIQEDNQLGITFPESNTNVLKSMLIIKTNGIANYSLTSKDTFSMTSGNYYKISFNIKTFFTDNCGCEQDKTSGAYFSVGTLADAEKSLIVSNDFKLYSIYFYCDNDVSDLNMKFGFVSDCLDSVGYALFDSFNFETIDKETYSKAVASDYNVIVNSINVPEDEENTEENTDSSNTSPTSATFWIALSTILMIVAVVIGIVGGLLRKVKFKKFKKTKTVEYSRNANLFRDANVAEAEERRNEEIKEIRKEQEKIQEEIKNLETEHKQHLADERKANGKKITRKSEREFRSYAATRQKLQKDIEKLDNKIEEMKSSDYVLKLVKIIEAEKERQFVNATTEKPVEQQPVEEKTEQIVKEEQPQENNSETENKE